MPRAVELLSESQQVRALAHPLRAELLRALHGPETAAGLARRVGRSRQNVSYHLKTLEGAGLVRRVGERRKGNFVEQLYEAVARRFVVSPRFASDPARLADVFADQVSLAQLATLGERLQRDSAELIDRAAESGERIPSATVDVEVCFADEAARAAFLADAARALTELLERHGSADGDPFRVALAAWPDGETCHE